MKISIELPIEKYDENQVYNSYLPPFSCTCLNRFSIKSIQGMVAQPTAPEWVGVFKNKLEYKFTIFENSTKMKNNATSLMVNL